MCYHKSNTNTIQQLAKRYNVTYSEAVETTHTPRFHENGFNYLPSAIITANAPNNVHLHNWGFIPAFTRTLHQALQGRTGTLNCISEEMYSKPAYRDAATQGKRCLIPATGFMEWKWMDEKGKEKIPYYIHLKEPVFSFGGLYSHWTDPVSQQVYLTYTLLTTVANPMMAEIHNSKRRMPVIIPQAYEKDFLNPDLSRNDVLSLCSPMNESAMAAYTISKLITSRTEDTNTAKVLEQYQHNKPYQDMQTSLF